MPYLTGEEYAEMQRELKQLRDDVNWYRKCYESDTRGAVASRRTVCQSLHRHQEELLRIHTAERLKKS